MATMVTSKSCKLTYKGGEDVGGKTYTRTTQLGGINETVMQSASGPDKIFALGSAWYAIAAFAPGQGIQTSWVRNYTTN